MKAPPSDQNTSAPIVPRISRLDIFFIPRAHGETPIVGDLRESRSVTMYRMRCRDRLGWTGWGSQENLSGARRRVLIFGSVNARTERSAPDELKD